VNDEETEPDVIGEALETGRLATIVWQPDQDEE
jgi:hypothetical protein